MSSDRRARTELIQALQEQLRIFSDQDALFGQAVADHLGINLTDFKCLSILDRSSPLTAGQLAELTGLTTGAITGVVDRLEKAGFVRRARGETDRRQVVIDVVEGRGAEFERLLGPFTQTMAEQVAQLKEPELELIRDFVARQAAILQEHTQRLRSALPGAALEKQGELTAPLGAVRAGRLRFVAGAAKVRLAADPGLSELYRARFEGRVPGIKHENGMVSISYARPSLFDWRKISSTVALNTTIPWEIEIRGGLSKLTADLSELQLTRFEVTGGASDVTATLPVARGVVPIAITGGASNVTFKRPEGVPVQVQIRGGASKLVLDDQQLGAIGGPTRLQSTDFKSATDRYEIELSGGASSLVVTTT